MSLLKKQKVSNQTLFEKAIVEDNTERIIELLQCDDININVVVSFMDDIMNVIFVVICNKNIKVVNILLDDKRLDINVIYKRHSSNNKKNRYCILRLLLSISTKAESSIKILLNQTDYQLTNKDIICMMLRNKDIVPESMCDIILSNARFDFKQSYTRMSRNVYWATNNDYFYLIYKLIRYGHHTDVYENIRKPPHPSFLWQHVDINWRSYLPNWDKTEHIYYPDDFKKKALCLFISIKICKDVKLLIISAVADEFRKIKEL